MTRQFLERRRGRRLAQAFLFVSGMGVGALVKEQVPMPALAQSSPNIAVREESTVATRIAVLEERLRGLDTALLLQAQKYEDRLLALNNSHAQAEKIQSQNKDLFVSKDEFKGFQDWREIMEKRLTTIEAARGGASGFQDNARINTLAAASLLGTLIALAGFIFMLITRRRADLAARDEKK